MEDFISVDMGGTSYDVCLVRGGEPTIKSFWNWVHRYLIALPMVDVASIGSGGGSIARVHAGGLQVGPESAGSDPDVYESLAKELEARQRRQRDVQRCRHMGYAVQDAVRRALESYGVYMIDVNPGNISCLG